jgi:pantothenate kinase-related protein Tda10
MTWSPRNILENWISYWHKLAFAWRHKRKHDASARIRKSSNEFQIQEFSNIGRRFIDLLDVEMNTSAEAGKIDEETVVIF